MSENRLGIVRRLPPIVLAAAGVTIGLIGIQWYLVPVQGTALGWAREIALVGYLGLGGGLVLIGIHEFRREQYDKSAPLLAGLLVLWAFVEFDFYSFSTNTQLVLSIAFLLIARSVAGTWFLLQRSVT
jgi:uncharacterized membrane protein HdeD (DUF308 family)